MKNNRPVSITPSKRQLGKLLVLYEWYRKKQRRSYVQIVNASRCQRGEYHSLLQELRNADEECHHQYFRISKERFDELLEAIKDRLVCAKKISISSNCRRKIVTFHVHDYSFLTSIVSTYFGFSHFRHKKRAYKKTEQAIDVRDQLRVPDVARKS